MAQCQFCGNKLGITARFCSNCGKQVIAPNAPDLTDRELGTISFNKKNSKEIHPLRSDAERISQHESKDKKPNTLSINAIRHTLFVIPESFKISMMEILDEFGIKAAGIIHSSEPSLLIKMSQQFIRNAQQNSVQYVCLIGNWNDIPPTNVPNSFMEYDEDDFCQTDAFYGAIEEFNIDNPLTAIPEITVGRIPLADSKIVKRVLSNDPIVPYRYNSFQYGVTAQCWEVASNEILSSFANLDNDIQRGILPHDMIRLPKSALLSSPEWDEKNLRNVAHQGPDEPFGLIFFNVHGGADEPQWVGESNDGSYVEIFQPGTIKNFNSALLLTEACYGGAMIYDSPSIVEHFFECSGNSFVGSSTIAYGARATPLSAADLIAKHYINSLYAGLTQGESLKLAKLEALTEDPLSLEYGLKTALSFNLFGAPWQTLTRSNSTIISNSTSQNSTTSQTGSVLDRVRGNLQAPTLIKSDTINKIRDRYQNRLPLRNRQFMIEKDEVLRKLREFKDFSRIIKEIEECQGSLENSRMDFMSAGEAKAFRLFCQTGHSSKTKKSLFLMIDTQGQLIKTIVSKGNL
jgi:hypothetical protein